MKQTKVEKALKILGIDFKPDPPPEDSYPAN